MYWVRGIGIFFLGVMAVVGMFQDVFIGLLAMLFLVYLLVFLAVIKEIL